MKTLTISPYRMFSTLAVWARVADRSAGRLTTLAAQQILNRKPSTGAVNFQMLKHNLGGIETPVANRWIRMADRIDTQEQLSALVAKRDFMQLEDSVWESRTSLADVLYQSGLIGASQKFSLRQICSKIMPAIAKEDRWVAWKALVDSFRSSSELERGLASLNDAELGEIATALITHKPDAAGKASFARFIKAALVDNLMSAVITAVFEADAIKVLIEVAGEAGVLQQIMTAAKATGRFSDLLQVAREQGMQRRLLEAADPDTTLEILFHQNCDRDPAKELLYPSNVKKFVSKMAGTLQLPANRGVLRAILRLADLYADVWGELAKIDGMLPNLLQVALESGQVHTFVEEMRRTGRLEEVMRVAAQHKILGRVVSKYCETRWIETQETISILIKQNALEQFLRESVSMRAVLDTAVTLKNAADHEQTKDYSLLQAFVGKMAEVGILGRIRYMSELFRLSDVVDAIQKGSGSRAYIRTALDGALLLNFTAALPADSAEYALAVRRISGENLPD